MEKKVSLKFSCGAAYKNKIYLASVDGNDLYEYDIASNRLRYIGFFEQESDSAFLYSRAVKYNNYVWFIPQTAENIAVLDMDTGNIKYIRFPYTWKEDWVAQKCASAGVFNEHYIYMVPYDTDALVIVDMETMIVQVYDDIGSKEKKYIDACYYNGYLFFLPWTADSILQFDIKTGKKKELPWKWGKKQYSSVKIDYGEKKAWFSPAASAFVLVYDLVSGKWLNIAYKKEISSSDAEYINSYDIKIYNDKVFFFPFEAKTIISVDKEDYKVRYQAHDVSEAQIPFFKLIDNSDMSVLIESTDLIYTFDEKTGIFCQKNIIPDKDKSNKKSIEKKIKFKTDKKEKIIESQFISLEEYLNYTETKI